MSGPKYRWCAPLCLLLLCAGAFARDRIFTAPRAFHAKTYPARDVHEDEKFSIAADPYDMPDKTAAIFVVDYRANRLLPVQVIFSNDGGEVVTLSDMRVRLIIKNKVKLEPADPADIYRRITRVKRREDESTKLPMPIPLPRKSQRGVSKDAKEEVEAMQFQARAVEPKGTQSGFFVFDVDGIDNPLAGATLEITGLKTNGQHLFYFEIPFEKYLNYQPIKP